MAGDPMVGKDFLQNGIFFNTASFRKRTATVKVATCRWIYGTGDVSFERS